MGYIYKIWNEENDKVYIGETLQALESRWQEHLYSSKTLDTHLYRAMRKYGTDKFHIEVVEQVSNDKLYEREKYWIQYYDSVSNGYNIRYGGEGNQSCILPLEEVEQLWQKGFGISEIAEKLNVTRAIVRNRIYTSKFYSEQEAQKRGTEKRNLEKSKAIIQLSLDGREVARFSSGVEAEQQTGIDRKLISQALRSKRMSQGYLWRYADKDIAQKGCPRNVEQYNLQGELLATYSSVKEASKKNNIPTSGIYATCNRQQKTSGGYIWKYKE